MVERMEPMRPVDERQVRADRTAAETCVQQIILFICAIPFVVLVIVGAPLRGVGSSPS